MERPIPLLLLALFLIVPIPAAARTPRLPQQAPDFTLPAAAGAISLHELRGKVVFIDFWASWCGPCRASFPWMDDILNRYGDQGLVIVAINLDKEREAADEFLRRYPSQFTVGFDPAGRTAVAFNVQAMPSSFIVSRDGRIVYAHEGFEPGKVQTLEDRIKEALSQ